MLVVVLMLAVAGCGGDDEPAADAETATTTAPATGTVTAPRTGVERVGDCLTQQGFRLQGGAPQATDTEAPEYQIILSGPRGGGYIGFYKNVSRAKRVAAQLRKNAQRTSGAAVERHGAVNIVWVDLADPAARESVRSCLVT